MADNTTITPGLGVTVAADDVGSALHQRVKISLGADGSATDALGGAGAVEAGVQRVTLASDDPAVAVLGATNGAAVITDADGTIQGYLRGLVKLLITSGTIVLGALPAGTALIGKVKTKFIEATASALARPANTTPYTANDAVSDNATAGSVTPISLSVSDVNNDTVTIERLRLKTTDTGVQGKSFRVWLFQATPTVAGGDNAAFSVASTGLIGTMSGTFRATSDGATAILVPDEGARIIAKPVSGAATLLALMQTLDAFTPSANSTTFTLTAEGFQGAA